MSAKQRRTGEAIRVGTALRQARHAERMDGHHYPTIEDDPDLAAAWHALQLHWLTAVPGYREQIKARVSAAAKLADLKARKIEQATERRRDLDRLGREIDPCG